MNIFYLSEDPKLCAEWMVDAHVIKMILESTQMLSTAHRVLDGKMIIVPTPNKNGKISKRKRWILDNQEYNDNLLVATHVNHPCAIWARKNSYHYIWLFRHFCYLCEEYTYRYNKTHKYDGLLRQLLAVEPKNIIHTIRE